MLVIVTAWSVKEFPLKTYHTVWSNGFNKIKASEFQNSTNNNDMEVNTDLSVSTNKYIYKN